MSVSLQEADFDINAEIGKVAQARTDIGAVVIFTGLCRDFIGQKRLTSLTLEHYPAMAQAELERLEKEALSRWPLLGTRIVHRYGRLVPGDRIVLVVTAAAHRTAAFDAATFLMDFLKTRAPFWKLEETADGDKKWVESTSDDEDAAGRWKVSEA